MTSDPQDPRAAYEYAAAYVTVADHFNWPPSEIYLIDARTLINMAAAIRGTLTVVGEAGPELACRCHPFGDHIPTAP